MNISAVALMGLFVASGCSATDEGAATTSDSGGVTVGLVTLDDAESQLEAAFNRNSRKAQLVVVLSPT